MYDTDEFAIFGDDQRGDLALFHLVQRSRGELTSRDGLRGARHHRFGIEIERLLALPLEQPAQVSVGDHAQQLSIIVDHCRHAQPLRRHFVDDGGHVGLGRDAGKGGPGVHERGDAGEALAEQAAGVQVGEILGLKAALVGEGDGDGVAESEHAGGGGSRGEAKCAGLFRDRAVEGYVGGLSERRTADGRAVEVVAGEGNEGGADALDEGEKADKFLRLAGGGEGDEHVAGHKHADVSVDGFGGVEEERGGPGGGEGGGDFASDDAAFAHAADDHASVAAGEQVDGAKEVGSHSAFEAMGESLEGVGFDVDDVGAELVHAE